MGHKTATRYVTVLFVLIPAFTQYFNASMHRSFRRFRVSSRARPARQLVLRLRPLLSGADCAFTQVKVRARRCHKERREVLCATNRGTLVYE